MALASMVVQSALLASSFPMLCPLFEGLSYRRWQGLSRNSLRVMEATAKAD
jgi:hypothetical protein